MHCPKLHLGLPRAAATAGQLPSHLALPGHPAEQLRHCALQELCPRPLCAARQLRQNGELLQHPHSRAWGVPRLRSLEISVPTKGSSQAQPTLLSSIEPEPGHPRASCSHRTKPWCPAHPAEVKTRPCYRRAVLEVTGKINLDFSISLLCPGQDTN